MKISANFDIRELVHPDIYLNPNIGMRCVDFIHAETCSTLEAIKEYVNGPVIINDWPWKGVENANYVDSGLRLPGNTQFAKLSSHRFGCGFDLKFEGIIIQALQRYIIDNQDKFPHITRMESFKATKGKYRDWLHIEIGTRTGDIKVFIP